MLRLVRFIIMLVILTSPFLVWNDSSPLIATPSVSAWCIPPLCVDSEQVPYCNSADSNDPNYCSLQNGSDTVKDGITGIETGKTFSQYVQDIIVFLLGFLTLIVVILIMWAGFSILTAAGDEEKVKSGKKIIFRAIIGLLIIFFAWSITTFIIGNGSSTPNTSLIKPVTFLEKWHNPLGIDTAFAATNDSRGFDYYRSNILKIMQDMDQEQEVDGKLSTKNINLLRNAMEQSKDTFSDSTVDFNTSLANNVLNQLALIQKFPDSDVYIERLGNALKDFLTKIKVGNITAKITATPTSGNAPLTTTLRATDARDPSGVTIPDSNYVWWIRGAGNTRQVIGKWPSIGYKFSSESVYTVNLDISSASRNSKGKVDIMPFVGTQEIKVLPRLANILLFINGANASSVDTFKITPNQGRAGLVIDASSSTPAAGATIMKTEWDFGNGNLSAYNGSPKLERQVYAQEGIYTVKIKITTNESPIGIEKIIRLISQDPIASIRADKTTGFAGDDFKFNATSNLSNALLSYEWNIMESDSGKSLFTTKNQSINYKFARMGDYIVRLKTVSAGGKEDTDNLRIQIDSKNPIANFEAKSINSETPNTISFDATRSFDPDSLDSSKLTFVWTIDGEQIELDNSLRSGMLGQYTFNTKGTHTVLLDITNEQGKSTQVKKDIQINSLLSVKLIVTPKITPIGTSVAIVSESKEATVFEWDFGDGETENSGEARVFHTYKKSGTYNVRLTVRGNADAGTSNSITRKVYIVDTDSPQAVISVNKGNDLMEVTPDACPTGEAYVTNRTDALQISGAESVNTDGTTDNLDYIWKYQGKTSAQKQFSYKFDELGCFPVSLTIRSQKSNKTSNTTVYIKVENALPKFASIDLSADKTDVDPVVISVVLNNAVDPDGVIVSYLWYYYTDSDPEPQDFRITKWPKTTFVVPKINGKYLFAVTMEDSNGAKVNSEEIHDERYSIVLASDNINTPLITLKTSSSQVRVEEEVTFQASVKNIIGKDLSTDVEYKWDFDGDGFYDETTKEPTVRHKYSVPGNYNMKVKAGYRGISNTRYQQIVVRNEIVPNLEYIAVGNTYALFNTTTGVFSTVKWTVGDSTSENPDSFVVTVPDDLENREVTLEVGDGTSTKTTTVTLRKDVVNANKIKNSKDSVNAFSYPSMEGNTITVENKSAAVYLYLGQNEWVAKYTVDTDIQIDTDLNGDPADDADNKGTDSYTSGAPFVIKKFDTKKERTVRITLFDAAGKKLGSRDLKVLLTYSDTAVTTEKPPETKPPTGLTDKEKEGLATLKDLISNKAPEGDRVKLMQLLSQLQENWPDDREKTKTIIDFQMKVSELALKDDVKSEFLDILDSFLLTDSETKDDIGLATSVLQKLIPKSNSKYEEIFGKDDKSGLVGEILSHPTNLELNKTIGEKILGYIKEDKEIPDGDKLILKEQLRVIIYGGSKNIPSDQLAPAPAAPGTTLSGLLTNILTVFLWIIGIVVGAAILLFIFFKIMNKNGSLGFQDFIIERVFGKGKQSPPPANVPRPAPIVIPTPVVTPTAPIVAPTIETLPFSPRQNTDLLGSISRESPAISIENPRPVLTPVTPAIDPMTSLGVAPAQEVAADIPDWLKSTTDRLTSIPEAESVPEPVTEDIFANIPESQIPPSMGTPPESELPSWLVGSNVSEIEPVTVPLENSNVAEPMVPLPQEEANQTEDLDVELPVVNEPKALVLENEATPAIPMENESLEPIPEPVSAPVPEPANEELPDWLKNFAPVAPVSEPVPVGVAPSEEEDIFGDAEIEKTYGFPEPAPLAVNLPESTGTESEQKSEKPPKAKKPKVTTPMPEIQPTANVDDLPDWLK